MKKSYLIAGVIALLTVIWLVSGLFGGNSKDESGNDSAVTEEASREIQDVRVVTLNSEPFRREIRLTGQTSASRTIGLRAETEGQVTALYFGEGDVVREGDLILQLDVRDREKNVAEARQRAKQREIEYEAARELEKSGYNSRIRAAQALADLETARAALVRAEEALENTNLIAPFEGILSAQDVEAGDYVSLGETLFRLVDLDPLEMTGFLTERQVAMVTSGLEAKVHLSDGRTLTGKVSYVAPAADEMTRTFKVRVSMPNFDMNVPDGLTARLAIPASEVSAHRISPAYLTLSDAGQIGLRAVTDENRIKFYPVNILADEEEQMWVAGLPQNVTIVTVGQEFVTEGQKVRPVQGAPAEAETEKPAALQPRFEDSAERPNRVLPENVDD